MSSSVQYCSLMAFLWHHDNLVRKWTKVISYLFFYLENYSFQNTHFPTLKREQVHYRLFHYFYLLQHINHPSRNNWLKLLSQEKEYFRSNQVKMTMNHKTYLKIAILNSHNINLRCIQLTSMTNMSVLHLVPSITYHFSSTQQCLATE